MAEVYLAEQTSLHRQVAIKVLRPELLSDPTILQRFEQEAKAAAGLIHPNIVQVYFFGQQEDMHYIAQEYVQGMNLRIPQPQGPSGAARCLPRDSPSGRRLWPPRRKLSDWLAGPPVLGTYELAVRATQKDKARTARLELVPHRSS